MPGGPEPLGHARALHFAGLLFGLLVLLALLAVSARFGEVESFLAELRSLAPTWLMLALLLQSATYLSVAAGWKFGFERAGHRGASLRLLLPLSVAKLFIDQTVPTGGMSGTAFLLRSLVRRGVPAATCMDVLVVNLFGHFAACALAALAAIALLRLEHRIQPWMTGLTVLFLLASLAIPVGVLLLRRSGRAEPRWLRRVPGAAALIESFGSAPLALVRRPGVVAVMTGWNAAVIALDASTLWLLLHALGAGVMPQVAFPSFLLAMMVTTLGPVPMGLGTFEATCVSALVLQGVPVESALAGTLLLRGFTTWLPMLPGVLLVRRELRRGAATG